MFERKNAKMSTTVAVSVTVAEQDVVEKIEWYAFSMYDISTFDRQQRQKQ